MAWILSHPQRQLELVSISPERKWKVKVFRTDPGAMASIKYYIEVTDLKRQRPTSVISLRKSRLSRGAKVHWTGPDTIVVWGEEANVRKRTLLVETAKSPSGRWKITVYDIYPVHLLYGYMYVEVKDLKSGKKRKITLDKTKKFEIEIYWKNDNTVYIYGQYIDLATVFK